MFPSSFLPVSVVHTPLETEFQAVDNIIEVQWRSEATHTLEVW